MTKAAKLTPDRRGHWWYSTKWIGVAALMGLLLSLVTHALFFNV